MNDFVAGYNDMLEDYLEPADPNKYGRYHTLLDETIYPLRPDIPWRCAITYDRMKFEKTRTSGNGEYNWWIHFNDFSWTRKEDMLGWTVENA